MVNNKRPVFKVFDHDSISKLCKELSSSPPGSIKEALRFNSAMA